MRFMPHTEEDIALMLRQTGVEDIDSLFSTVPDECRFSAPPDLPGPLTEWELNEHIETFSRNTAASNEYKAFLGAGSYLHHIPATIHYLLSRSEFATAYTPYQPEMSQGTLQATYEYQTLIAELLGMEVANASMYDGASALAEALLMAIRITRRSKVAVSKLIHPNYLHVVQTYLSPMGHEIVELPYLKNGRTDVTELEGMNDLAAVAIQSPNFFGCIEDLAAFKKYAEKTKALLIASFTEPIAYGLFKNPGSLGADIVCGEGQSLGIPQSFGGPGLGLFAGKRAHVRRMPGRLVGKTTDTAGQRGFVLTLATREQHIRREKATSNICSNSGLNAIAAAIYMASLGSTGMRELARLNYDKSEYLKRALAKAGFEIPFNSPTFNEFAVKFPKGFKSIHSRLLKKKIIAGLPLAERYPELSDHYLLCVTETMSRKDMNTLVREVTS